MGAGPMIMMGAGGAIGAYGQLMQGEAEAGASEFNAKVARNNAALSIDQAREEERRNRIMSAKAIGTARANIGGSGITLEGSALDALRESAMNAEIDARTIRSQGEVKAYGYNQAASLDTARASSARMGSYFGAASSLLGAGAHMAAPVRGVS